MTQEQQEPKDPDITLRPHKYSVGGNILVRGTPTRPGHLTVAEIVNECTHGTLPLRISAFDGSSIGPAEATLGLELLNEDALTYLVTAPGDLGLARGYPMGDIIPHGVHPGAPHDIFSALETLRDFNLRRPSPRSALKILKSIAPAHLKFLPTPAEEEIPFYRRTLEGLRRHSKQRDIRAITHHYDVSNAFYRMVLGSSMTYTCAVYDNPDTSLEEAQENKYRLVFHKLGLKAGDRLLDVGCGWGGFVVYAARHGVKALGVTLSLEQAQWAKERIIREGLEDLAEVREQDYRDIPEGRFDAISSIGLTEHIGVSHYHSYFTELRDKLRDGGRLLNHSITRPNNPLNTKAGAFIDRYIFPDGELTGSGRITVAMQNVGLEVWHSENLRPHYALTLHQWCSNLVDNWDAAVDEVGESMARLWGLYMGACEFAFQINEIQLHQILATRTDDRGHSETPLRQWWKP